MSKKKEEVTPVNLKELTALVSQAVKLRDKFEKLEEQAGVLKLEYNKIVETSLPDAMGDDIDTFKISKIKRRVHLKHDIFIHVAADNRAKLQTWFRRKRMGQMITEVLHPGTLKKYINEQMDRERRDQKYALPPSSLVKVTPTSKAVITKIK